MYYTRRTSTAHGNLESWATRTMPKPIAVESAITLPYAPEQLWPYVANTQRMDRAVGLPEANFRRVARGEGGEEVTGEYRLLRRFTYARWNEHPFSWQRARHYSILREYDLGPIERFLGGAELEPIEGGNATRIRVFAEFTPRRRAFSPLIKRVVGPVAMHRSTKQYATIAAYLAGQKTQPYTNPHRLALPVNKPRLDSLIEQLCASGVPIEPAHALGRWLVEADDEDVVGMRPLELAGRWGTDERETLESFLRATVAGVLEMRWELICPSCRGMKAEAGHLRDLAPTGFCAACGLPIAANVDEAIEARFYPVPAVRKADIGTYCVGNPMDTPHRIAQATLPPGETSEWRTWLPPGPFTIRSPQSRGVCRLEVGDASAERQIDVRIESTLVVPDGANVAAGEVVIRLTNTTAHWTTVVLDDGRWGRTAATPGRLMTLPAFRALFSAEALAAGIELAIARVGLLFTDLAGSTALYERAGEARAFRLVGEHFDILRKAIEGSGGAMIKTIGDSVMGAFPDGAAALQAALTIQRDIHALDTSDLADPTRLLKVGVHAGPCYAVTLNQQLDYFGGVVNLASRAQHEATGGQIVVTDAVLQDAAGIVTIEGLVCEPFQVQLRGVSGPVRLHRIDCTAQDRPGDAAIASAPNPVMSSVS